MKISIVSDLHMEIWKEKFPQIDYGDADIVCFLGDIHKGSHALEMMAEVKEAKEGREVFYIVGNHELYRFEYHAMMKEIKERASARGIIVLENEVFQKDGFTFIGATCWTDYEFDPQHNASYVMVQAAWNMNDHYLIDWNDEKFKPQHAKQLNDVSKQFIFNAIAEHGNDKSIVLTHHAPTKHAVAPRFHGDPLNGAFCNNWDDLIRENGPKLWAFGHTHFDVDIDVGDTRVVARQLGYPGERMHTSQGDFEPLFIDL